MASPKPGVGMRRREFLGLAGGAGCRGVVLGGGLIWDPWEWTRT